MILASCTLIVSQTLRKVPRLVGEDVESGKRRQRVPDNLRDTWFTTVPTKVYQHFYNFTFMSTSVPRFLHLWPHLLTLVAHPSFNILLILCSQKEFGQWLLSQRDLWRLCQWAAFSGKQREDLGRKHDYHFSASIAIFFGHFPLWRESWWIPASYCGCKFRAEVSFSQFGIFWARWPFSEARCILWRRESWWKSSGFLPCGQTPSLSSADTHNGLLRAAVGERRSLGGILCFSHHR